LTEERAAEMYRRLRGALAPGGRVLTQSLDPHQVEVIRREGYEFDADASDPLPTVRPGRDPSDRWYIFRATSAGRLRRPSGSQGRPSAALTLGA